VSPFKLTPNRGILAFGDMQLPLEALMTTNSIPRILLTGVYDDASLQVVLGVGTPVLARARQMGELRSTRKGRRVLYLGEWVLDWLRSDGQRREPPHEG
jgi:hypothetical protein